MAAGFSQRFPAVTGDLGSIWSCQNEMRNRSRQIGGLYTDVNTVIGRYDEWTGLARDAFVTSADAEKREIGIWEDGTLQAANALKSYYFTLEWVIGSVNGIRARADELWEQYQAMPPADRATQEAAIEDELSYLQGRYEDATTTLSEEALNTGASLREALYFTPEDLHKEASKTDGTATYVDYGDTRSLTQKELADMLARLGDPSSSLFNIDQGRIGDCHLLASLNAYNQTEAGRRYLASLITPHYGADGKVDGFYVDFPGFDRDRKRVFVQDVLEHGDTAGRSRNADLGSIFEKAFVQSHMGGTRGKIPTWGASGSLSALTMWDISGKATHPTVNYGINRESLKTAAIDAVTTGNPVVAESSPFAGQANVSIDGNDQTIKVSSQHVYTVVGADSDGVTLTNPWGYNETADDTPNTTATFTMSWDEFYANFGDVTVGQIP